MFANIAEFCVLFIIIISYLSVLSLAVGGVSAVLRYRKGDGFDAFMKSLGNSVKTMMVVFIILGIFYFIMAVMGDATYLPGGVAE